MEPLVDSPQPSYPIAFRAPYGDGRRSRGLAFTGILYFLKLLIVLPNTIVQGFVVLGAILVGWIGYFVTLFTGRLPSGMQRFIAGSIGWSTRSSSWLFSLTDRYPPFELHPAEYPTEFTGGDGSERRNRGWAFAGIFGLKLVAALPHLIVWYLLYIVAAVAGWIGYWIILFTGRLPSGIHTLAEGAIRWNARVVGWMAGLTDRYPPFGMSEDA